MDKCGVCNLEIPLDHASLNRREWGGTATRYHFLCGDKAKEVKPCQDCREHRLFCDDCKDEES